MNNNNDEKLNLAEIVRLLDQQNADVLQYCPLKVRQLLRKRLKQINQEAWRKSLPWPVRMAMSVFLWFFGAKNEPLKVGRLLSEGTEGFLYEVALNIIQEASGVPLGQDQPQDRTEAVKQESRLCAQMIAKRQLHLHSSEEFIAPEVMKDIENQRENWETMFVHLREMVKGLPKEHGFYWNP